MEFIQIPKHVFMSREISHGASLLYGAILLSSFGEGRSYRSNDSYSEDFGCENRTITRWVKELNDAGFISVEVTLKKNSVLVDRRYITPLVTLKSSTTKKNPASRQKCPAPVDKNNPTTGQKYPDTVDKNVQGNIQVNIQDNIREGTDPLDFTDEEIIVFRKPTFKEVSDYCIEKGYTIDAQNFIDFYSSKGWMVGKNKMQDWQACVRTWQTKDNKRNKENANRKTADQRRSDYASEIRDYHKAISNF